MGMASGIGLANITAQGTVLDVWFPQPTLSELASSDASNVRAELAKLQGADSDRDVQRKIIELEIDTTKAPASTADVYLRLHLLSHRLVKPHGQSLEGIFGLLPNVVWTSFGPCLNENFEKTRARLMNRGHVTVYGVDKFPRMVDYVIPSGVRIADADRVRLGAYLSSGTTVMHEGFVNFNAGTLGASMVEGRISAGVIVGDGSDIGGGASIMGTLSGGGKEIISIGEKTLLGANAGLGISLGNNCVVEAGLYLTAASKVTLPDGQIVKARELSGGNNLLFRRNSQNGSIEALPKEGSWGGLNSVLHAN
ncbi:MAG: 2,3,4,5-tetrahydropyridine-2,6-dicarboxylate N-succinyltransferase [Candidatus Nanopelagicaceae bacterium]|jgi:2,3,4,5-tetrahydropyridine-2-carboxylate N-succinyltransferase